MPEQHSQQQLMQLPGYKIDTTLGDGGMATVYKGVQLSLQRPVAIKVLKKTLVDNAEVRERFERESLIIARLNHPNIIHVIDQGLTDDGRPYFVMEYVKSISLDTAIEKNKLTISRALDIFTQIAKALAYAHKNGVIHCDIKPENILVDFEGFVRVLDFGIAQIFEEINSDTQSDTNLVMGTPNYMAPEQHKSFAHATEKSDIYALGVVMYRYFTSHYPNQYPESELPKPSALNKSITSDLDSVILQCLKEDPSERTENADTIKNQLLKILQGKHINATEQQRAADGVKKSFQLLDIIKEDDHGAVYLFQEQDNNTLFIIKKKPQGSPGYNIAKRMSQIKHANITEIFGCSENERAYIMVMEYCGGGSLNDRLAAPYKVDTFLHIALQLTQGIHAAHSEGIVHGNLRPSNVLFDEYNSVKISDFGLDEHYKENNANWYTLESDEKSVAGDIFSLGVVFYQMLTGEIPEFKDGKLRKKRRYTRLPKDITGIISRMISTNPKLQFRSCAEVRERLGKLIDDNATQIRSGKTQHAPTNDSTENVSQKPGLSTPQKIKLALLLVVIVAVVGVQALLLSNQAPIDILTPTGNPADKSEQQTEQQPLAAPR